MKLPFFFITNHQRLFFSPVRVRSLRLFVQSGFCPGLVFCLAMGLSGLASATVVGRMAGNFSVSSAGGVIYRIPIGVAAGQNGMKPDISLVYSSGRGDGLSGVGWTISGLSKIARCNLIPALDGKFQGVRFSREDRYCLDNQPLLRKSWSNIGGPSEYATEIYNYERIYSFESAGTGEGAGPKYFEVRHRNGLTYQYGYTEDSRVEAVDNPDGAIRIWALNEIRDTYNTRIFLSYEEDSQTGEFRPKSIKWSARAGGNENNAHYRIVFHYEDRPAEAKRSGYTWGAVWAQEKRLKYIDYDYKVSGSFSPVHRYTLNYKNTSNGSGRSVLEGIQQCGPGVSPDCLPATTFETHTEVKGWLPGDVEGESVSGYMAENAMPGDFNGDGRQDIFVPKSGSWYVLRGEWGKILSAEFSWLANGISTGKSAATPESTAIIDYNGDGLSDLLTPDVTGNNWHVYLSNGTTFSEVDLNIPKTEFTNPVVMDINGDGLDEILYRENGTRLKVRINNGSGFDAPMVAATLYGGPGPNIKYPGQRTDFDGDGRDDYFEYVVCYGEGCGSSNDSIRIYLSNGTGFDYEGYFDLDAAQVYGFPRRSADVNGDGLSDIVFAGVGNGGAVTWHTMLSHGHGLEDSVDTKILHSGGYYEDTPFTFADYNMDGCADLVVGVKGAGGGWMVYPSNGMTFSSTGIPLTGIAIPGSDAVFAVDIGGTGYPSLVFDDDQKEEWSVYAHKGGEGAPVGPDSLTRLTDGLGNYFDINSRPLTRVAGYSGNVKPPVQREFHAGSYYVVGDYETNDGTASGAYTISYLYSDPKQDMQGRGLLGFKSVQSKDSRDGTYKISTYRQDFPYLGKIDEIVRYQSDDKIITKQYLKWDNYPQEAYADGRDYYFVHLAQSPVISSSIDEYEVDPDGGSIGQLVRTTKHKVLYDFGHGVIKQDAIYEGSPAYPNLLTTTVATEFESFSWPVYCLGFPSRIDVSRSDGVNPDQLRTVVNDYNSECKRTSETVGPTTDTSQQLVTTFEVDGEGKLLSITRGSGDGAAEDRKIAIGWDTTGGYRPVAETAEINGETSLTAERTWNYGLGLEPSPTYPRGEKKSLGYDDFGRLEQETRPGPSTTTVSIENCTSCFPAAAEYKVHSQRSDGFWSESFHDSYGRVVGQASVVLAGASTTESRKIVSYDSLGRVVEMSMPFLAGDTAYTIGYLYDLRGRIKLESRPSSNPGDPPDNTLWTYDRLNIAVTEATGVITTYLNDPVGRLIEVRAPLGSGAQYEYWPQGELKNITQGGVVIKSMTYDERGFPATMTDIDSGTWSYSYSVFGEQLTRTDDVTPTPNTITMVYDQLGRPRQRIEAEGTTNWIYHQAGSGLGLLDEVTGPLPSLGHTTGSCTTTTGYCEKYGYDSLGRIEQATHQISAATHMTNYGYNNESQIEKMTYPAMLYGNRYTFVYTYSSGHLDTIDKDMGGITVPVYDVINHDAFGNEVLIRLFGDFNGETEYDHQRSYYPNDGRIQSIQTGVSPLGSNAQNYVYTWSATGDLSSREDVNQGNLIETFSYDALHRLDKTFLASVETSDIDYYANGNIKKRSVVGTYNYAGPVGSRAVTSVTDGPRLNTYHYDANGNMDCRGDSMSACTRGDSIEWTSFNKPKLINLGSQYSIADYGPDRQLVFQKRSLGSQNWNMQYIGAHFEKESNGSGKTRWRASIFANGRAIYQIAEHRTSGACSSQQGSQGYFVLRDHQNSVDVLLNDGTSSDHQYSFDAFGKRRNVTGWQADTGDVLMNINHKIKNGYTGHEHLDNIRLIHMKGRVQDPIVGRMISPDPLPGEIRNPQSLNSYTYVMNNPLSLVDPSGFCDVSIENISTGGQCPADEIIVQAPRIDGEKFPGIGVAGMRQAEKSSKARQDYLDSEGRISDVLDRAYSMIPEQASGNQSLGYDNLVVTAEDLSKGDSDNKEPVIVGVGGAEGGVDLFFAMFGVSGTSGQVWSLAGKSCTFNQQCFQVGLGGYVGVTGQGLLGFGRELENGTVRTVGAFAVGSFGAGVFGTLDVNSGNLTLGAGFSEGIGGAGGFQFCSTTYFGCQ